jgi:DNA-binding CsgD family transcriptional regulator
MAKAPSVAGEGETVEKRVAALEKTVLYLQGQFELATKLLVATVGGQLGHLEAAMAMADPLTEGRTGPAAANRAVRRMSAKQHAVLQMVLRGTDTHEIAERLDCSESTAKTHVRGIMKHLRRETGRDVLTKQHVVALTKPVIDALSDEEYLALATIPKSWDAKWTPKDRKAHPALYETKPVNNPT